MLVLVTQVKPPTLCQAGKSFSSAFLSCCTISSFFLYCLYLLLLPHHLPYFLTKFLLVSAFSLLYSVLLQFLNFYFQDHQKMVVSRDAWQQSLPLPFLDDGGDFPGDPLDDGLGGVVLGLPGQH